MSTFDHAIRVASAAPRFRPAAIGGRVGTVFGNLFPTTQQLVDVETPTQGIEVGVVDTGLVLDGPGRPHPYLDGRVAFRSTDVEPEPGEPIPAEFGHGTFIAGLILHEAPGCRVVMRRGLLDAAASGQEEDAAVAEAITDLVDAGVGLINLSFTGDGTETEAPSSIVEALYRAKEKGVLVVAAVSNDPTAPTSFPAQLADPGGDHPDLAGTVLPVTAGDETMHRRAASGDRGRDVVPEPPTALFGWQPTPGNDWLHCRTNGVAVLGPHPPDGWVRWSGCSFAAAQFTGSLAAETHRRPLDTPDTTPREVAESLKLFDRDYYHYGVDSTWSTDPDRP